MAYNIKQHTYNFAVWTAARSVARKFTKTEVIKSAIEASTMWKDVNNTSAEWSQEEFDRKHKEWADDIIKSIGKENITCSFGRAAKIIAVFLKTAVILPEKGEGALARVIHPPIDRILLGNLKKIDIDNDIPWTKLDEGGYKKIIDKIKGKFQGKPLWNCEEYWSV